MYWQTAPFFTLESSKTIKNPIYNATSTIKPPETKAHNIAKFKLFGETNLNPTTPVVTQKNLPKTKLKLTLTGVLVSPLDKEAGALILGPDQQTQHYKIGDKLPGDATLKQVYSDRVIISRLNNLENLYFVEKKTSGIERISSNDETETQYSTNSENNINKRNNATKLSSARSKSIKDRLSKLKKRLIKKKP
jgi:general secretion pathway protein C